MSREYLGSNHYFTFLNNSQIGKKFDNKYFTSITIQWYLGLQTRFSLMRGITFFYSDLKEKCKDVRNIKRG
jgi:hypothetical protein